MTTLPEVVAVIGGGRMGAGIAQVFAAAGATVTIVEANADTAAAARARVAHGLAKVAEKQSLDADVVSARVHAVTSVTALPPDAGLVIEAVPERAADKIAVLTAAEQVVAPAAVLASNTSSLSIAELGAALARPHRLVGLHFFNPVPASGLVEVVRGSATDDATIEAALRWIAALNKREVLVNDSPGFATSRLGVALGLEAIRMLDAGVADAAAIDRAMELGYRHAMGPLRSTDLVGLDVRLAIAEHLHTALGDRFAPPQLLRDKVARGELGRKSGRGFYQWPDEEGAAR